MKYTVFGKWVIRKYVDPVVTDTLLCRVIDGMDTLDTLEKLPVVNTKSYRPLVDTKIRTITIHANPLAG